MGRYNNPYQNNNYNNNYNNPYQPNNYETQYDRENSSYSVKEDKKGISWGLIIVLFFIFPPIAFFLLLLKLLQNAGQVSRKPKKKAVKKSFSPQKLLNTGSIICLILSVCLLFSGIQDLTFYGINSSAAWLLTQGGLFLGASALIKNTLRKLKKKESLRQKLLTVIGNRAYMLIGELADIVGISLASCRKQLDEMIDDKLLPAHAYIDMSRDMLVINAASLPTAEPKSKPQEKPSAAPTDEANKSYADILSEICRLNDDIDDKKISAQIYTMESLTRKIFNEVEKNPSKLPQIRSFLNYYLPTTLKLLQSYADLEDQWGEGTNINTAKKDIERIMDTLVDCYKLQLDKLFANEKLDIATDIQVLENMMARDGIGQDAPFATRIQ